MKKTIIIFITLVSSISWGRYRGFSEGEVYLLPDNQAKSLMAQVKSCYWVDSVNSSRETTSVVAYEVPSCNKINFATDKVCNGTVLCNYGRGGSTVPIYFENVMCVSKGNSCIGAKECLSQGGVLNSVRVQNGQVQRGQVYRPETQGVSQ